MPFLPLPAPLPDDLLAKREQLPLKPAPVTLTGRYVRLVPVNIERDSAALHALSNGAPATLGARSIGAYDAEEWVWRYLFAGPFATLADFQNYVRVQIEAPDMLPFCVVDVPSGQPVGMADFMSNVPAHLKIELGSIWYSPLAQRTPANTESTYLMLAHAFALGYRRVEWKCNALNQRSRRAALRLGFKFEGIQEAHYIIKGRNRDTAWFRILDHEWPEVKVHLEQLVYGA